MAKKKLPVVVTRSSERYELQEFLFKGLTAGRGRFKRKNNRLSTRVDWYSALIALGVSKELNSVAPKLRAYYLTSPRSNEFEMRTTSASGLIVGCHYFSRSSVAKIVKWAGINRIWFEKYFPKTGVTNA